MRKLKSALIGAVFTLFLPAGTWLTPTPAQSFVGPAIAAGLGVDAAVDKFGGLVDRARDAAMAIEKQTNEDVKARLDQVDQIVDDTMSQIVALQKQTALDANQLATRAEAILAKQTKEVANLEDKFMRDLSKIIREVQCSTDRILQEQLKDTIGTFGPILGTNTITITPPVLIEGETMRCRLFQKCRVQKSFRIATPFTETYREVKKYLIEERIRKMGPNSPVESVIDTYSLIADFAKRTTCFTTANDMTFEAEYVTYAKKVREWNAVLTFGGQ
jgi:uncharacterized protein YciI